MKINTALIDFLMKGVVDKSEPVDFAKLNAESAKKGWIIHPDCCNKHVAAWVRSLAANHNATFYREWNDVISKSRFELFVDQILHYASTYGKWVAGEEPEGNGWVPNDGGPVPRFEELKVLEPITAEEAAGKCLEALKSGIALKDATMKALCDFLVGDFKAMVTPEAVSEVKNREASCYLSSKSGVLPADEFGMLRCLMYAYTEKTELIKSASKLREIKSTAARSSFKSPLLNLSEEQLARLSRIFLRFKPLFLAMKAKSTAAVINKLRRLAVKNHRPFKIGFWEDVIPHPKTIEEVRERLPDLDAWRKIRLMMTIKEKLDSKSDSSLYVIRSGKMFVRTGYTPAYDQNWLNILYLELESSLVEQLRSKACLVKFPEHYSLALPTSEKNFVGGLPFGTYFDMKTHNVVGIYWRNEWGAHDFDLSAVNLTGGKIGWNAAYYSYSYLSDLRDSKSKKIPEVVYSGDMTNADPHAVELLYMSGACPDMIVKVNKFYGKPESKLRFFFANEDLDGICNTRAMYGHMVNPNNIRLDTMVDFTSQDFTEKTLGMVVGNRFYVMDLGSGVKRVSRGGKYVEDVVKGMKSRTKGFIPLKDILLRAGFTIWTPPAEGEEERKPDLDLTTGAKDALIGLFS